MDSPNSRYSFPKQQCSFKAKQKKDWFKVNADYYINRAMSENSHRMTILQEQYDYLNHNIPDSKYHEVMGTLQANLDSHKLKEFKSQKTRL